MNSAKVGLWCATRVDRYGSYKSWGICGTGCPTEATEMQQLQTGKKYIIYSENQKYSRLRCLLRVKGLVVGFYLGWSGHTLLIRKIKVGSKSLLLTCSSNKL